MTTATHAPTTATLSRHCAGTGPIDPPQGQPMTHAWCRGCACDCHPRRLMRARLTSLVLSHHALVDVAAVLAFADVLLHARLTPAHAERAITLALDAGWTPPDPT